MLSIGLMSGTSMDGIDAALLATDGSANQLDEREHISIHYHHCYKILLKAAEYSIRKFDGNMRQAQQNFTICLAEYLQHAMPPDVSKQTTKLQRYLQQSGIPEFSLAAVIQHSTNLHIQAVKQLLKHSHLSAQAIDVIGYHGQTLLHQPHRGISTIVGDGQVLADQTGIKVINDFRSRDVAAGGQGAPFAPLYHQALAIRDNNIPLAVVNCGGIANITLINSKQAEELIAFDTGPGNVLLDQLMRQRTGTHMDKDGQQAQQATITDHELATFLALLYQKSLIKEGQNYFEHRPPKSLDCGDISLIPELNTLSLPNACKVLAAFTADSIVKSLDLLPATTHKPHHWILSGGGWHNTMISQQFKARLQTRLGSSLTIKTADEAGWNNSALEAQLMAFLAVRSLQQQPLSFTNTTQVPMPMTGGQLYHPHLKL